MSKRVGKLLRCFVLISHTLIAKRLPRSLDDDSTVRSITNRSEDGDVFEDRRGTRVVTVPTQLRIDRNAGVRDGVKHHKSLKVGVKGRKRVFCFVYDEANGATINCTHV
jgi:hypothetical protein